MAFDQMSRIWELVIPVVPEKSCYNLAFVPLPEVFQLGFALPLIRRRISQ